MADPTPNPQHATAATGKTIIPMRGMGSVLARSTVEDTADPFLGDLTPMKGTYGLEPVEGQAGIDLLIKASIETPRSPSRSATIV